MNFASNYFLNKKLTLNGRIFNIHIIKAENGCFLLVYEGEEVKFGSMALSVKIDDRANSNIIIPSKFGDIYSRILSESLSMIVDGIVVSSLYAQSPIDAQMARSLLEEVKKLL